MKLLVFLLQVADFIRRSARHSFGFGRSNRTLHRALRDHLPCFYRSKDLSTERYDGS